MSPAGDGPGRRSSRLLPILVGMAALALLAAYAFDSGERVGSDMAARDSKQKEARN